MYRNVQCRAIRDFGYGKRKVNWIPVKWESLMYIDISITWYIMWTVWKVTLKMSATST